MLSILLFGTPQLCLDQRVLPLLRRKNRALVYYLAAQPDPVRRERLLTLLWPEHDRATAQHNLRTLLHGMRQTLGPALVVVDDALALAPDAEVDARRFTAALVRPHADPQRLEATLALYRGEFLDDVSLPDSPAFDDWVAAEREHYRELAMRGLTTLAQQHATRDAWPAALAAITRAVDLDPLREDVQSLAMQLQYFAGDRTGAIRRYEQLRKLLDDELGLPPTAETRAAYDAMITERLQPEILAPAQLEPGLSTPGPPPDGSMSARVSARPESVVDEVPILATKLYLPQARPDAVPRPRLHARLDRGRAGPLTLIAAPAGSGKTTLVAEWLPRRAARSVDSPDNAQPLGPHVAWLSLDAADSDPIQFLRYLIAALQTLAPTVGRHVLALLNRAQVPRLEPLMPLIINELVALPDPTILVLDDYHVIEAAAVHQAMAFLLDHLPPQLHLVVTTRMDPPLPLARLRARGQLTELRAHDLRFTPEETAQFLREVMGVPLQAEDVAALEARTEGWIAGLQLAALSLQNRPREQLARFIDDFTGSHRFVVDYLVDEVLARLPVPLQIFLLRTSILDRLSATLCDVVIAEGEDAGTASKPRAHTPSASQAVLEELERSNLFLVPLDDARRWYRYHHLFAQVLRERLMRGVSPDIVATLHCRASAWFEGQRLVVEAVQHALAAQDWQRSTRLIEAHGRELMDNGQVHTVLDWLNTLPTTLVRSHPDLLLSYAVGLFCTNQLEAAELHARAIEAALAADTLDDHTRTILGYATNLRGTIARFRGNVEQCVILSCQTLAILPATDVAGRTASTVNRAWALVMSGDAALSLERDLAAAVVTARTANQPLIFFHAAITLAGVQRRHGRLRLAAATCREAAQVAPEPEALRAIPDGAAYYFLLGDLMREWNDVDAAEQYLMHGRELVRGRLLAEADATTGGYIALARLQQARGDGPGALAMLEELVEVAREQVFVDRLLARRVAARAHLALLQGDVQAAVQWADRSGLRLDDDLSDQRECEYLSLARVWIAQGCDDPTGSQLRDALHLLERLLASAEAGSRMDSVIEILILRALAFQACGALDDASATLTRALTLAAPEGYVRVFVDEGAPMAALLRVARDAGVMPEYVATLLAAYPPRPVLPMSTDAVTPLPLPVPSSRAHIQALPESLTNRELDVLRLLAVGYSNQAIARELIVAVGTVKRHVSNIMDKLQAESRLAVVARGRELGLI